METPVPTMRPAPGERLRRYAGDSVQFVIQCADGGKPPEGWRALLRTNLGRGDLLRREIVQAHMGGPGPAGASWRDLPMRSSAGGWQLELPLAEVGYFKAKAYLIDPRGWQHWPTGPDVSIAVHPDRYRTANIIYCAFPRLFGKTRSARNTRDGEFERAVAPLDAGGYTVVPPSGKLRELTQELPHIFRTLSCRILHLLPVHPTPTTFARFGRFGSPYAALDLTAIDPALVLFDKRTTGTDQFKELTYQAHYQGGRVFLDIVINHTGWDSVLQENHPEWFLRHPDGRFASPGAWGVTWEDLVELRHENIALWDELAEMFLIWCRRGVDGFRCDAGYKVPVATWQYIVARVQQEYPETIFLLEGLGGAWDTTEALLTEGGMQWAYSELFQNYSGLQVAGYLEHSIKQTGRTGLLVHYSETHDNERLAVKGRAWSLLRNRLCGLTSVSGGFGYTCGVEWLADEKILVHGCTGLAWGASENLLPELGELDRLLAEHPCFFDGARLTRLSPMDSPIYALWRESEEGLDRVLVLVNTDVERSRSLEIELPNSPAATAPKRGEAVIHWIDLLGQTLPELQARTGSKVFCSLAAGAAFCLSWAPDPNGLYGEDYRRARARAAWGLWARTSVTAVEAIGQFDWRATAAEVDNSPVEFLARTHHPFQGPVTEAQLPAVFDPALRVVRWAPVDARRVTLVPPGHWLLVEDSVPFRASLSFACGSVCRHVESVSAGGGHVAGFTPHTATDARLLLERYAEKDQHVEAVIRFLSEEPDFVLAAPIQTDLVLLTNGRGAMARLRVDLGFVQSKYDCVLGANLHPTLPVDRHVFAKRIRAWVNADGFISPLDFRTLARFEAGPPAIWHCIAPAGDGRTVEIQICAGMLPGQNTTLFSFSRPTAETATGKQLPAEADVRLTVRVDIEDRNFHWETKRNGGAEHHFASHVHPLSKGCGFAFTPAHDRRLRVFADTGTYHPQPEWSENLPHPVENTRGQTGSGDAYSPGWFELPMPKGGNALLGITAESTDPSSEEIERFRRCGTNARPPKFDQEQNTTASKPPLAAAEVKTRAAICFEEQLRRAIQAFVVRRGDGKTVIAGYPWFLDWGRDTFICARGLLAAGMADEVKQLLVTFARFEQNGTLPNTIFGEDAGNRDTSDAPLWFGVVCEELAEHYRVENSEAVAREFYQTRVDRTGRTLLQVLQSIASNYARGTPNGIRMDADSALIWSPSHFTWMDTNYPAGTPREGYPVEIQALWIRLLKQLERVAGQSVSIGKVALSEQAMASLDKYFWRQGQGYYADVLLAKPGQSAANARGDDALRSNYLFVVSLGLSSPERSRACIYPALRYLVVPGALRTLAPLPVSVPLPIHSADGRPLNNPREPYWGRYEGDEDTRRKPAYHNGTAWTWTFPTFCEAMARAWSFSPEAVAAARAYLGSMARLMSEGCLGQLPEILDGDAPHMPRGCDAQAWAATEALRVWRLLEGR